MIATLRQRDFGLLWLAGLISIAGDVALMIALPLHVYRLTGSSLAIAVTLAVEFLPRVLLGSVVGVFVDRWDRKRTMVLADVARAVVLLPLLVAPDAIGLIFTVAAVQGTIGLFFGPAENALLPAVVGEERLVTANALNALNDNLGFLIGPAVGAVVYARWGLAGVALVDAVSFLGSAALIRLIAADGRPMAVAAASAAGSAWARMVGEWQSGLAVVRRQRALRVLFAASFLGNLGEGAFMTLAMAPLVLDVLGGTPAQVGLLASAQAVGGLVAGLAVARIGGRYTNRWLVGIGLAGVGLADLTMFNARSVVPAGTVAVGVAMGCMFSAGFPAVAFFTGRQTLVQTAAADAFRGRVFAALNATSGAALLIGFAVAGALGDAIGIVPILSAGAIIRIGGGLVALLWLPPRNVPDDRDGASVPG